VINAQAMRRNPIAYNTNPAISKTINLQGSLMAIWAGSISGRWRVISNIAARGFTINKKEVEAIDELNHKVAFWFIKNGTGSNSLDGNQHAQ
jgi:hypothetical protein